MALFITRSTRSADTTGPTAPTITASAASSSTVSINRTAVATDASGISLYETQRSASGAGAWSTFDSSNTNPLTAAGLSASTAYDFRQRAVDSVGNAGTYSAIVSATTQADASAEWADVYTNRAGIEAAIAVSGRRVGIRGATTADFGASITSGNGAVISLLSNSSFDGLEPVIELRPPTTLVGGEGQYATILATLLNRGGLNSNFQINFRWLEYIGPTYYTQGINLRPKWTGIQAATSAAAAATSAGRCAIFDQPNGTAVYFSVTAATVQSYNYPTNGYFASDGTDATKLVVIRGTPNHALTAPQIGNEWVCFEQVAHYRQDMGKAFGMHRLYAWTRDGVANARFLEIPLNWDGGWNFANQFANNFEGLGAYFNGSAPADAGNYKRWSHCTIAANMQPTEVIGPPPGFLL